MSPRWGMLGASLLALGVLGPDPALVRLAELADKLKLAGVRPRDIGAVGGESLDSATKICERVLDAHRQRCAAHPGYAAEARTRLRRHKMARRAWHVMAGARAIKPRIRPIEADEWPTEAARMCLRAQLQDQYRSMRQVATDLDPRAQLRQLLAESVAEHHRFSWAPVPDADGNITLAEFERQYAEHLAQQRKASASIEVVGGDPRVLDRLGLAPAQPAVKLQWDSPDTFEVAPPKRITINLRQPATPPTPEEEAENAAYMARMMEGVEALQRAKAAELARESSLTQSEAEALLKRCGGDLARARGCVSYAQANGCSPFGVREIYQQHLDVSPALRDWPPRCSAKPRQKSARVATTRILNHEAQREARKARARKKARRGWA